MANRGARGVISPMLNLRCEDGHRWFSPTPSLFADDDLRECGYPLPGASPDSPSPKSCRARLKRYRARQHH